MSEPVDEFGAMVANQVLNAFELTPGDVGVPPMDLSKVDPMLVPAPGSADASGLEYGGMLNLLASTEPRTCGLHPGWGENLQCPRCAEILMVRRLRSDYADLRKQQDYLGESNRILSAGLEKTKARVAQLAKLASLYEQVVCVCTDSCQSHLDQEDLDAINEALDVLGLQWNCDEGQFTPGGA